jgi:hypothetical protein
LVFDAWNTFEEDDSFEFDSILLLFDMTRWSQQLLQNLMEFLNIEGVNVSILVLVSRGGVVG